LETHVKLCASFCWWSKMGENESTRHGNLLFSCGERVDKLTDRTVSQTVHCTSYNSRNFNGTSTKLQCRSAPLCVAAHTCLPSLARSWTYRNLQSCTSCCGLPEHCVLPGLGGLSADTKHHFSLSSPAMAAFSSNPVS
jgi:hypothetical protein